MLRPLTHKKIPMKNLILGALVALPVSAAVVLAVPAQDATSSQSEAITVMRAPTTWDYKVVGLTDIHAGAIDTAKAILDEAKSAKDLLDFGKKTDAQLVEKTEKVLDEMGADGWELIEYRGNVMIFKKPLP
tara:strand:+ start:2194 stop:2586 length:393 start_codon:yes stop_codon:yes gene_type:complete